MKKEMNKPKSMFGEKENEEHMEHEKPMHKESHEHEMTEKEINLGGEHKEEDATGAPVHPKLQEAFSKLEEPEEEPLMPHRMVGLKKK